LNQRKRKKTGWVRTGLQRLASALVALSAVLVILTAVLVGVGRALVPHVDQMRPWLETQVSERSGIPIGIARLEAQWPQLTPQLTLRSVRVGEPDAPLATIDSAQLEIHLPGLFQHDQNLFNVVVLGLDIELTEDEDGHWGMRLAGGGQLGLGEGLPAERVLTGNLLLRDARLRVAPRRLPISEWQLPEAELERSVSRTALVGRMHPDGDRRSMMELRLRANHPGGRLDSISAWLGVPGLELDVGPVRHLLPPEVDLEERLLQASAWLEWTPPEGARIDVDFAFSGGRREPVSGSVHAVVQQARIDAELLELSIGDDQVVSGLSLAHSDRSWGLGIDFLDLAQLHRLAAPIATLSPWWPERLAGELSETLAVYRRGEGLHWMEAKLHHLQVSPSDPVPGVDGLDAAIALDGDRLAVTPGGTVTLEWPRLLRQAVRLDRIEGRLLLAPDSIEFDGLAISHEVVDARADGWIYLGEERPFLDFGIEVGRVEPGDPRPWLPHGIIPPRTLEWLDQALVDVEHASGSLLFHMRAGQRAADFDPGDFHAEIEFSNAEMAYWPEWPSARLHRGRVEFLGYSLFGQVPAARMADLELSVEQAVIANLTEPELAFLVVAEQTDAAELADLLGQMPVAGWRALFEQTRWFGPLAFATEVTLPFRQMPDWHLDGEVSLDGVGLVLPNLGIGLSDLRGTAFFDRHELIPAALQAMAAERMLTLDLAAGFEAPAGLEVGVELHPADLVIDAGLAATLSERITGSSYWHFRLDAVEDGLAMTLSGDLEGLGLDLPEPMTKLKPAAWPLTASARLQDEQARFQVSLADRLDIGLLREGDDWRSAIGVSAPRPDWPAEPGFVVDGRLEQLDLEPWAGLIGGVWRPAAVGGLAGRSRLSLGRLAWGDLHLEDVDLELTRSAEAWEAGLSGIGAQGRATVPVPLDSGRVLAIDLAHLHLHDDSPDFDPTDLDVALAPGQTSTASPVGLPPLHVLIEDLRYRELDIGRVRIEAHAASRGMEIERVEADGPTLNLRGGGRWIQTEDGPFSEFEGRLITASLTDTLAALGYETGLEAARTQADIVGRWPGAPHDFSLQRFDGELAIEVADGLIPEARPGAGRLLGLVSIGTIPRRLTLDFRDVFAQGLKFDRIEGRFELADGVAVTENLRVDSPAARIRVSGSTDMIDRRYDQYLVVEPGVGSTLPILGVLAGGPMGAAAGLVLQALFDRPLRGVAEARYAVTGSWDDPAVELVEARVTDEEGEEQVIVPDQLPGN
jgi:uncharacterized protein (TIGR02099 family)